MSPLLAIGAVKLRNRNLKTHLREVVPSLRDPPAPVADVVVTPEESFARLDSPLFKLRAAAACVPDGGFGFNVWMRDNEVTSQQSGGRRFAPAIYTNRGISYNM